MTNEEMENVFGKIITAYGREDAINDGVLVDVTETAKEAGFKYPMALTEAVYNKCVKVPEKLKGVQDESGRLWDICWVLLLAIKSSVKNITDDGLTIFFQLVVNNDPGKDIVDQTVALKCICGGGDNGEPVLTVMFPNES